MKSSSVVGSLFLGKNSRKYKNITISEFFKKSGSQRVRHYNEHGEVDRVVFIPGAGLPNVERTFNSIGAVIKEEKIPGKGNPTSGHFESIIYTKTLNGQIDVKKVPKSLLVTA